LKEFALLLTASFFHFFDIFFCLAVVERVCPPADCIIFSFFDIFFCLAVVEGRVKVTMSWSLNTL